MPGKAQDLVRQIDRSALPAHIAIIMDGNGRWARKRGLPRVAGHRAGISAVREVVEGIGRTWHSVLTLYAFSVENWKRPQTEVSTLMKLLKEYLNKELENIHKNNIRFRTIGRTDQLDASVRRGAGQGNRAHQRQYRNDLQCRAELWRPRGNRGCGESFFVTAVLKRRPRTAALPKRSSPNTCILPGCRTLIY